MYFIQNAVGCLMYAMILTSLDILYVASVMSRYMVNLKNKHWKAVKWILRYPRGTSIMVYYIKDKAR